MDMREFFARNEGKLTALYGKADPKARYEALAARFNERFGREAELFVSAPGRTEVVGNHTDHNRGCVLAAAVDLDTVSAVAGREDMQVTLYSEGCEAPFVLDLADLSPVEAEKETTLALIRGVAAKMQAMGLKVGGFDAYTASNVFKGSGLSSSAAFEVMVAGIFDALFNGCVVPNEEKARISQYAENVYFGKPSGLMDQMASAVGGLVGVDFGPDTAVVSPVQYDFSKKGYVLCVTAVGSDHADLTDAYASIPREMHDAAKALGVKDLAQTDAEALIAALPALKGKISDRAILRAFHFFDETARAKAAVEALKKNCIEDFFRIVRESGESSWRLLQNLYVPEREGQAMPLALALTERLLNGEGAWRVHGGGFGGTILAFVPEERLAAYKEGMERVFGQGAVTPLNIRPEGCVCLR